MGAADGLEIWWSKLPTHVSCRTDQNTAVYQCSIMQIGRSNMLVLFLVQDSVSGEKLIYTLPPGVLQLQ